MKFLCDGSVQSLVIGLFYTTTVNRRWETVPWVELLLSSGANYRECSGDTLNCITIEQNLRKTVMETEFLRFGCGNNCVEIPTENVILNVSMDFTTRRTVKRGDYLGLVIPPLDRSYEDALPVIYMGEDYESPFIALPPGSFLPSRESDLLSENNSMVMYLHLCTCVLVLNCCVKTSI